MRKHILKIIKEYIYMTIGIIMVAAGVYYFLDVNKIAAGGANGLAVVINHYIPSLPIGFLMLAINIVLFVVAFIVIGPGFGGRTIYASLGISGAVWVMEHFLPLHKSPSGDLILDIIFGIVISGAGMGIVFNQNASTGGTDIIAKILKKFFHIELGKGLMLSDFTITLLAGIAFGAGNGMYSLLAVVLNGYIVDNVIEGLNICKEVKIISENGEIVKNFIINELERGVTVYEAKGAYTGEFREVILSVLSQKDFIRLREFMKENDKDAFITVSNVHEVLGEGFKNIIE